MKTDKLLKLAEFLEKLPPEKLDMSMIVQRSERTPDGECGTVCCAWGWCPKIFPTELKWVPTPLWGLLVQPIDQEGTQDWGDLASEFFGLDWKLTNRIFCYSSYCDRPSPSSVAARIRTIIREESGAAS